MAQRRRRLTLFRQVGGFETFLQDIPDVVVADGLELKDSGAGQWGNTVRK